MDWRPLLRSVIDVLFPTFVLVRAVAWTYALNFSSTIFCNCEGVYSVAVGSDSRVLNTLSTRASSTSALFSRANLVFAVVVYSWAPPSKLILTSPAWELLIGLRVKVYYISLPTTKLWLSSWILRYSFPVSLTLLSDWIPWMITSPVLSSLVMEFLSASEKEGANC